MSPAAILVFETGDTILGTTISALAASKLMAATNRGRATPKIVVAIVPVSSAISCCNIVSLHFQHHVIVGYN